jgi:hypothetical protein
MAAGEAQVSAWLGFESGQPLLTVSPQPAIERAARILAKLAIRQLDRLAGQLAHELSPVLPDPGVGWQTPQLYRVPDYAA